tara:strand:- start:33 stop:545 length:513 start_codon:yes stop_codon:yes gene_type:complete
MRIVPKRFIPPPAIYQFGKTGLEVVEPSIYFKDQENFEKQSKYKFATLQERIIANLVSNEAGKNKSGDVRPPPFDLYCPSMEKKLDECICETCGSSWPSAAAKNRHSKAHKSVVQSGENLSNIVDDEFENENDQSMMVDDLSMEERMPIFGNINEILVSPFEQLNDEFLE